MEMGLNNQVKIVENVRENQNYNRSNYSICAKFSTQHAVQSFYTPEYFRVSIFNTFRENTLFAIFKLLCSHLTSQPWPVNRTKRQGRRLLASLYAFSVGA